MPFQLTRQKKILLIGGFVLLGQLVVFSYYISPFYWGELKVNGLVCTCPDESVVGGQFYLKFITPDSLKKYNLDYSEIYVTNRPYTNADLEGIGPFMIEGKVIGKKRAYEDDPWNPKFRIDKWKEIDWGKDLVIKILFFGQFFIWFIMLLRAKKPSTST